MNKVFLHSKQKYVSLISVFLGLLIPFFCYGIYKNGVFLYINKYINLIETFKSIFFVIISIIFTFVFSKIKKENFFDYRLLCNILISLVTFPNTNIIIFLLLMIAINFLFKYVNIVSLYMVLYSVVNMLLKKYTYLNIYEKSVSHNYSLIDLFVGKSYGGFCNTLIIMSIISLILLCLNRQYKKYIPLTSLCVFYFLLLISIFIKGYNVELLLNSNVLFSIIFIAPLTIYSPYSRGGCYISGALLGVLVFIFSFFDINLGIYVSISLISIFRNVFDKFVTSKSSNNLIDVL